MNADDPEWIRAVDANNTPYFFHKKTREVSWVDPTKIAKTDSNDEVWYAIHDAKSNKFFFFNQKTGAVTWQKPENVTVHYPESKENSSTNEENAPSSSDPPKAPSYLDRSNRKTLPNGSIVYLCSHSNGKCFCENVEFSNIKDQIKHNHLRNKNHGRCDKSCKWRKSLDAEWNAAEVPLDHISLETIFRPLTVIDPVKTSSKIFLFCSHCKRPNKIDLPKGNEKWATLTTCCGAKECHRKFTAPNPHYAPKKPSNVKETSLKKLECPYCDNPPILKKRLDDHIRRRHEYSGPFFCEDCAGKFEHFPKFKDHQCVQFICPVCDLVFSSKKVSLEHQKLHGGTAKYVCFFCERSFKTVPGYQTHTRLHLDETNSFGCFQCGLMFSTDSERQEHLKSHGVDEKDPAICCVCKASFPSRHLMLRHQRPCFQKNQKPGERLIKRKTGLQVRWEVVVGMLRKRRRKSSLQTTSRDSKSKKASSDKTSDDPAAMMSDDDDDDDDVNDDDSSYGN